MLYYILLYVILACAIVDVKMSIPRAAFGHFEIIAHRAVVSSPIDPRGGATLHIPILTMTVIGATPVEVPPCTYPYLQWR